MAFEGLKRLVANNFHFTESQEQKRNRELCGSYYNTEYEDYIYVNEIGDIIKPGYLTQHFPLFLEKNSMRRIPKTCVIDYVMSPHYNALKVTLKHQIRLHALWDNEKKKK